MTKQEFKEIRLALGLSQQQLASKLGILKNQISKIERGAAGITEQKEEVMKLLLREHRLSLKSERANSYARPKREKICFAYPWYSYQKK